MNDRFKFRVYHLITGKYVDDGETEILLQNAGILLFGNWRNDIRFAQSEYGIEQCTGLKDKNGNLIYEGDVVKQIQYDFDPDKRRVVTGIIKWHPGHSQFVFEYTYPDGTGHNISEIGWGIIEIIDNIHEQAEQKE